MSDAKSRQALIEKATADTKALWTPFDGNHPSGVDISDTADFLTVKKEVGKIDGVRGERPDWSIVQKLCEHLLATQTKDLRLAAWRCLAMAARQQWLGLIDGAVVMSEIMNRQWDTMYPHVRRPKTRAAQLEWLVERLPGQFDTKKKATIDDGPAIEAAERVIELIDKQIAEKTGDRRGGLGPLRSIVTEQRRYIESLIKTVEEKSQLDEAARQRANAEKALAEIPRLPPPPAAPNPLELSRTASGTLLEAATLLHKQEPENPLSYRLRRIGAWLELGGIPSADAENVTAIAPPPADLRERLSAAHSASFWRQIASDAEELVGTYPLWLDLNRIIAMALDHLGLAYTPAREAVGRETVMLIARLPALTRLRFSDKSAMCDDDTKNWLADETIRWALRNPSAVAMMPVQRTSGDPDVDQSMVEARKLIASGAVEDGFAIASELATSALDARTRFRARLVFAQIALESGKPAIGRTVLDTLVTDIDRHKLEVWEPALCTSVYSGILAAAEFFFQRKLKRRGRRAVITEAEVFERLCRLDPAAALQFPRFVNSRTRNRTEGATRR